MHDRIRRPLILVLVLTGLVWIYRESFLAMASKWLGRRRVRVWLRDCADQPVARLAENAHG